MTLRFDGARVRGPGLNLPAVSGVPVETETSSEIERESRRFGPDRERLVVEKESTFEYTTERSKKAWTGPLPRGRYWIDLCEERSFRTSPFSHGLNRGSWGRYSWSMRPDSSTDTDGRSGFFLHGSSSWGSAGCIDLMSGDTKARKVFERIRSEREDAGETSGDECCRVAVDVEYREGLRVIGRETSVRTLPSLRAL